LFSEGQTDWAIRLFTRAVQDASNARYFYCLGAALARAGKAEEAIHALHRSIELDPSRPDAYMELAQIYGKAGQPVESRNALREYLRFMPQNIKLRSPE
jgi:cytochrome c-type biogenesis protein CcmH/NrfG